MLPVSFDFLSPKLTVCFRDSISTVMTMPETTIDENCNPVAQENKIWTPLHGIVATPPFDTILLKNLYQAEFSGFVPL